MRLLRNFGGTGLNPVGVSFGGGYLNRVTCGGEQQASGQLEKPSELRTLRREIARIETVLTEKNRKAQEASK